jgi:hypothetical protein
MHRRSVLLLQLHSRHRWVDRPILPRDAVGMRVGAYVLRLPVPPLLECGVRLRAGWNELGQFLLLQ